jgi:hypothetical protein
MKQTMLTVLMMLFLHQCLGQRGFPKQFQATLTINGSSTEIYVRGVLKLLYDYENLRARFDVQGWRAQQNETYMLKYKPDGAEADSVS